MKATQSGPSERPLRLVAAILIIGGVTSVLLFVFDRILLAILAIGVSLAIECGVILIAVFAGGGTSAPRNVRVPRTNPALPNPEESLDTSTWAPRG